MSCSIASIISKARLIWVHGLYITYVGGLCACLESTLQRRQRFAYVFLLILCNSSFAKIKIIKKRQETQTRENRMRTFRMTRICRAIYFNNLHIMCATLERKWADFCDVSRKTWSPALRDLVKIEKGSISGTPCVFCGDNDADGAFFVGVLGTRTRATRPQFATSYDAFAHHSLCERIRNFDEKFD